jgi:hypothetical protein
VLRSAQRSWGRGHRPSLRREEGVLAPAEALTKGFRPFSAEERSTKLGDILSSLRRGEKEWRPMPLKSTPGPEPLGSARKKGRYRKSFARSVPITRTSGETARGRSRGKGSEGAFTAQRTVELSVVMERARANQEAWLTWPLGSSLYPLGLALSYTPCGARCIKRDRPRNS